MYNRIVKLSLGSCWEFNIQNTSAVITCVSSEYLIPKFEIFVDQSLSFTFLRTFVSMLSEDHELYSMYDRSFFYVTLSNFISHMNQFNLCDGVTTPDPSKETHFQKHVIPKTFNYSDYKQLLFKPRTHQDEYYRSNNCKLFLVINHLVKAFVPSVVLHIKNLHIKKIEK